MDTIIAVTFEDPGAAYPALTKLDELDGQRQIALTEAGVVERTLGGQLLVRDEVSGRRQNGAKTLTGEGAGLLLGVLGGPVGVLLGGTVGGLVGAAFDLSPRDEDDGLLAAYARHVAAGTTAVLAALDEPLPQIVDAAMVQLGGSVRRSPAAEVAAELRAPHASTGSGGSR
jgi:uncharacterized membrane protein